MTATAAPLTCGTCGTELGPGALFCLSCGTAVPREHRSTGRVARPRAWFDRDGDAPAEPVAAGQAVATEPVALEAESDPAEPEPAEPLDPERVPTEPAPADGPGGEPDRHTDDDAGATTADIPVVGRPRVARVELLDGPPVEELPRRTDTRRSAFLAAVVVVAVLMIALLSWALVRPGAPSVAGQAVSAWRAGNAAWAKGQIDIVCDRYDGIGADGMWRDRATCVASESEGYGQSTAQQRESLEAMTVDPRDALVLDDDLVVIMYRDTRVDGELPPYFAETDFAVMRRTADQGWRQVGVRYGKDVVGNVPPAVLRVAPPAPTATASAQ